MHQKLINQFVANCLLADFSQRSIQALSPRLKEFSAYLKKKSALGILVTITAEGGLANMVAKSN